MLKQQDALVQQQAILQGELQKTAREMFQAAAEIARDLAATRRRRRKPK